MDLVLTWENDSLEKLRREFLAPATVVIGRSPTCEVSLPDERASRRHCSIRVADDLVQLTDLGSANGTLVNGTKVTTATLADTDSIQVGDTKFKVTIQPSTKTERLAADEAEQGYSREAKLADGEVVAIAGYEFVRCLGQGAFGAVFEARDEKHRTVAIKILKVRADIGDEDRRRFFREAATAKSLVHPNVVQVLDQGQAGPTLFIVMDFVPGETVRSVIAREGPVPIERALLITRAIASALEAAREKNLVHRDVKPDNILLGESGAVKLADFGFAKSVLTAGQSGLTHDGDVVGTVAYMSPEQLQSAVYADHRSDIYSLGATLYHMLSGQTPFTARTNMDYFKQILNEDPTPIATLREDIPPLVKVLVERCLRKKPEERYRTAGEIVRLLDLLLSTTEEKTHTTE